MTLLINPSQEQELLQESFNSKRIKVSLNSVIHNGFQFWWACRNFRTNFHNRSLNDSYLIAKNIHKTYLKHYNSSSIKDFIGKIDRISIKEKLKNFDDFSTAPHQLKSIFDPLQEKVAHILSHHLPNIISESDNKCPFEPETSSTTHVRLLAEKSPHDFANLLIKKLELILPEQSLTNNKRQFSLLTLIKNLQCHKRNSSSISTIESIDPQEILDYHCKRVWPEEDFFINKPRFNYVQKTPVNLWIFWPSYENPENKSLEDSDFTSSSSSVFGC